MSKMSFHRRLLLFATLLLSAAPLSHAQGELYSDADIGIELGQARRDHGITFALQGGMGNSLIAPGFAYEHFFDGGKTVMHVPFNIWWTPTEPGGKAYEVSNLMSGTGGVFRRLVWDVASSPFYGAGMRVWMIHSTYERHPSSRSVQEFEFDFFDFVPLATGGYTHRITSNWSVTGAVELGWLFSSYDDHANQKEDPSTGDPPSTDPSGDPPWSESGFYWTIELSGSYLW